VTAAPLRLPAYLLAPELVLSSAPAADGDGDSSGSGGGDDDDDEDDDDEEEPEPEPEPEDAGGWPLSQSPRRGVTGFAALSAAKAPATGGHENGHSHAHGHGHGGHRGGRARGHPSPTAASKATATTATTGSTTASAAVAAGAPAPFSDDLVAVGRTVPALRPLSVRLPTSSVHPAALALAIEVDSAAVTRQTAALWALFQQLLPACARRARRVLLKRAAHARKDALCSYIFRERFALVTVDNTLDNKMQDTHARVCDVTRTVSARLALAPAAPATGAGGGRPAHTALGGCAVEDRSVADTLRSLAAAQAVAVADARAAGGAAEAAAQAAVAEIGNELVVMFEETYELGAETGSGGGGGGGGGRASASAAAAASPAAAAAAVFRAPDSSDGSARNWARYRGEHVIVLCHGYQGSHWDMRMLKNLLATRCPAAQFLISSANAGRTEGSIAELGQRLAREIVDFILRQCPSTLGRLSFVGHSMGGIIIRAALAEPIMRPFLRHCYTLVTLASPHCGYIFSEAPLVSTGLWFLRKWTRSKSLSQLSFSDAASYEDCFVYRLAQAEALSHFRYVFLLASRDDKYAPFYSARVQRHEEAGVGASDTKGRAYSHMVRSLLRHLTHPETAPVNVAAAAAAASRAGRKPGTPAADVSAVDPAFSAVSDAELRAQERGRLAAAAPCACIAPYLTDRADITALASAPPCLCGADGVTAVPQVFRRFEVSFGQRKRRTLDSFIGRQAHIFFLDVPQYFNMFLALHWKAFL
jgi:hypothetical protein